jgi:hypothetical protein
MKPRQILLRCFAERKDGYWQAFCVDLCLAVQGDSAAEVKKKLHAQITDYLRDILGGEDQPYAGQLLRRKSPPSIMARYYLLAAAAQLHRWKDFLVFRDTMPLKLA